MTEYKQEGLFAIFGQIDYRLSLIGDKDIPEIAIPYILDYIIQDIYEDYQFLYGTDNFPDGGEYDILMGYQAIRERRGTENAPSTSSSGMENKE